MAELMTSKLVTMIHPLVQRAMRTAGGLPRAVVALWGYVGPSPKPDHVRLYADLSFRASYDIPVSGIIGTSPENPEDPDRPNCLYVIADTQLIAEGFPLHPTEDLQTNPVGTTRAGSVVTAASLMRTITILGLEAISDGGSGGRSLVLKVPPQPHPLETMAEDEPEREVCSADLLAEIGTTTVPERQRRLICQAEVIRFDAEQIPILEVHLLQYVDRHLKTEIREEQVAVGSAIRKLVAMLPVERLPQWESWLAIERGMPPVFELELVKMITRKLVATIPKEVGPLESLGGQLVDLLRNYLNPRILAKRYFGATALEATLSLALLRSGHMKEVVKLLNSLRVRWFLATVARQASQTADHIAKHYPVDRSSIDARGCLLQLAGTSEAALS